MSQNLGHSQTQTGWQHGLHKVIRMVSLLLGFALSCLGFVSFVQAEILHVVDKMAMTSSRPPATRLAVHKEQAFLPSQSQQGPRGNFHKRQTLFPSSDLPTVFTKMEWIDRQSSASLLILGAGGWNPPLQPLSLRMKRNCPTEVVTKRRRNKEFGRYKNYSMHTLYSLDPARRWGRSRSQCRAFFKHRPNPSYFKDISPESQCNPPKVIQPVSD